MSDLFFLLVFCMDFLCSFAGRKCIECGFEDPSTGQEHHHRECEEEWSNVGSVPSRDGNHFNVSGNESIFCSVRNRRIWIRTQTKDGRISTQFVHSELFNSILYMSHDPEVDFFHRERTRNKSK